MCNFTLPLHNTLCLDYIMKKIFSLWFFLITEGVIQVPEEKQYKVYAIRYIFWLSAVGNICKELGNVF